MKNKLMLLIPICIMFLLITYFVFQNIQLKQIIETNNILNQEDRNKIDSYPKINFVEYSKIFHHMLENLKVTGYTRKGGDTFPGITAVDPDLTFHKRKILNLTDEINTAVDDSTQNVLLYENSESKRQISIIFAYVPDYMESNMINCFIPSNYEELTPELSKKVCASTINYKNIVITFIQTGISDTNIQDLFMAIRCVQKQLDEYK